MVIMKHDKWIGRKLNSKLSCTEDTWKLHWSNYLLPLQVYKADLVLLAMGFLGPERYIINELELEQDPRSNISTPPGRYSTSVDKIFAAGGKNVNCDTLDCLLQFMISFCRKSVRHCLKVHKRDGMERQCRKRKEVARHWSFLGNVFHMIFRYLYLQYYSV